MLTINGTGLLRIGGVSLEGGTAMEGRIFEKGRF